MTFLFEKLGKAGPVTDKNPKHPIVQPCLSRRWFFMPGGWGQLLPVVCSLVNGLVMLCVVFPFFVSKLDLPVVPADYVQMVQDLVNGEGLRWKWQEGVILAMAKEPGYFFFLSFFYILFGDLNAVPVQVAQILLNASICWMVWMVAYRTTERRDVATIAAWVYAFHPLPVWYSVRIWNDIPASFFVILSVLFVLVVIRERSRYAAVFAGCSLAVAALFRILSGGLLFLFLVLILFPTRGTSSPEEARQHDRERFTNRAVCAGIFCVSFVCIFTPWIVRNVSLSGHPVLLTIQGWGSTIDGGEAIKMWSPGKNVYHYAAEERKADLVRTMFAEERQKDPYASSAKLEVLVDGRLKEIVLQEMYAHPFQFLKKVILNLLFFWYLGSQTVMSLLMMVISLVLLPMALAGTIIAAKQRYYLLTGIAILIAFFWAAQSSVIGYGRYSVSVLPYVVIFGALTWSTFLKRFRL